MKVLADGELSKPYRINASKIVQDREDSDTDVQTECHIDCRLNGFP